MESRLSQGEVALTLDGKEVVLKPTMMAMRAISRTYNGFGGAFEQLRLGTFDCAVNIIRVGANLQDREARHLDERVFAEMGRDEDAWGEILLKLIRYVRILQNGGKPLAEDLEHGAGDGEDAPSGSTNFSEP